MSKKFDWRAHLKVHPAADLFPLMAPDELRALADDIAANGLNLSVALANDGRLLDGRNRLDALALLDTLEVAPGSGPLPFRIKGTDHLCALQGDVDPYAFVISANICRRHLTAEQKRELIAKVLKAKPNASNNSIAKQVKANDKTVAAVRREMEGRSEIPNVDKRTDSKGRKQPATRPKHAKKDKPTPAEVERDKAECIALAQKAGLYKANQTDTEVAAFDTLVRELLRGLKGKKPQRFAKTTVALPLLGDLASFIRDVVAIRKLADDPSASAAQRKADYAASEASR
jgi:hypothetical protein